MAKVTKKIKKKVNINRSVDYDIDISYEGSDVIVEYEECGELGASDYFSFPAEMLETIVDGLKELLQSKNVKEKEVVNKKSPKKKT
jgi:hypothetical protein